MSAGGWELPDVLPCRILTSSRGGVVPQLHLRHERDSTSRRGARAHNCMWRGAIEVDSQNCGGRTGDGRGRYTKERHRERMDGPNDEENGPLFSSFICLPCNYTISCLAGIRDGLPIKSAYGSECWLRPAWTRSLQIGSK